MITRRDLLSASAASVAISAANPVQRAAAQPHARTVHILTGFAPGLLDALGRLVAGQMKDYAASIVVEPRPGAGGRVAVEAVKTGDVEMLQDLVLAAVNEAARKVDAQMQSTVGGMLGGLGIPGI